jgi:hypothetical protein
VKIAVIGAGATGARTGRQLLAFDDVEQVVVADLRTERRDAVVQSLGSRAVAHNLVDGPPPVDAAILATPAGEHGEGAATLLRAGIHVVSVSDSCTDVEALLELDHEATERGLSIVVGAGFSPGLSCLLARQAAEGLDQVDEIHVARVGTGGPACARQHHEALGGSAIDWRDGGWVHRRGGSGRELCWFPDPIGGRDCYRAALPDALLLVPAFPGVERVTARLGANRRDRLTARLPMMRPPHAEGGPGALRVEVRGRQGSGRDVRVRGAMDRPSVAAGAVAALAAHEAVLGQLAGAGASGLASVPDARAMLRTLHDRGVRAAVFEGAAA